MAMITSVSAASSGRGMSMIQPAEQWREALPSGNGTIGALVYGSVHQERVLFNHNKLWYQGRVGELPDVSAELPVVRQLLLEGKYREANEHYRSQLKDVGFNLTNARYHPAFDMDLITETNQMFEEYLRTVDFETGEVEVTWRDGETRFSRKLFVSIPDDVSVMSITADQAGAVDGSVTLNIHDLKDAIDQQGKDFDPGFTYQTQVSGEFVEFRADGSDGGEFGGVLRVLTREGSTEVDGQKIRFAGADEVVLIVALFANEPASAAVSRLKRQLAALEGDYDTLFARHAPLHREKFDVMEVNLNPAGPQDTPNEYLLLDAYQNPASPELVQKLFDYGRYLLISSSRSGGYPANLQGIWNGDYRPPWSAFLGNNENLQMAYWQALPGNLKESMMGFFDYFDAHLDEFRHNAQQLYGCRGIFIPPFMSPESGVLRHTGPHVIYWTDAAGWLASFYYDYYLFTGDEQFLRERAIPFMKEVALFYEDYIVKDEQGKNMFLPAQSPENQPADKMIEDPKTGHVYKIKVQINSTIAVAVAKEVFHNLVEACEHLNVEAAGVQRWKEMLADMPEYQVNEDGAIREWMHPDFDDNYEHRHQSHIYPLFPGTEVTEETNPEIYEACRVAIEKRLVIGLQSQTGWSLAHMANVYARLGDGAGALEALNILARSCLGQNLFTYHNDWRKMGVTLDHKYGRSAPFQMDANFGIPAAVMEMLCGSTSDMLRILPAVPEAWGEGSFRDMLTRSGVRTSANWNLQDQTIELELNAVRDALFDLKFPAELAELNSSQPEAVSESKYGSRYRTVKLAQGDSLKLNIQLK
ncbi:glycoside hydrolase N-terminal domain-containing protein [Coraliomargarita algicola]|uniref:Glycoside hydrolase N-terminal domain-containing protein n=1 Tax=Coraliomargarita algicola TaxID=3092156 RepID=A0ABZ0RUH6_9BACT|nr:glycoside hydrolase N-terminal domain-containing protein [Coraliomargarita sp. J2-16]WPJ96604.1 glycoside hydrolase N-terminal domain-containing protein [Coraliomargarita sp. J2-16]